MANQETFEMSKMLYKNRQCKAVDVKCVRNMVLSTTKTCRAVPDPKVYPDRCPFHFEKSNDETSTVVTTMILSPFGPGCWFPVLLDAVARGGCGLSVCSAFALTAA